ncbi:MAG: hypothetical protein ACI9SK_001424 [Zhongshania sp.]|jgi:hypothetical protein
MTFHFRQFLERHKLGKVTFDTVNVPHRLMRGSNLIDAVPNSTTSQDGERKQDLDRRGYIATRPPARKNQLKIVNRT